MERKLTVSINNNANNTFHTAGDNIINGYCTKYETTTTNYILPPAVTSKYPEERDPTTDTIPKPAYALTRGEEGKQKLGLENNQKGEVVRRSPSAHSHTT